MKVGQHAQDYVIGPEMGPFLLHDICDLGELLRGMRHPLWVARGATGVKDGEVIAGSLDDAVESRDIWTFSHDTGSDTPAWLLDETDEG